MEKFAVAGTLATAMRYGNDPRRGRFVGDPRALLGLIAVAGYQNRDKLAAMFSEHSSAQASPGADTGGLGAVLGGLIGGGGSSGGLLTNGLRELMVHFQRHGNGEAAQSG